MNSLKANSKTTRVERNPRLYWQYFGAWIMGIFLAYYIIPLLHISPFLSSLIEDNFPEISPLEKMIPFTFLFSPLLFVGLYGFLLGYSPTYHINHIQRGTEAIIWNLIPIVLYVVMLLTVLVMGIVSYVS